MTSAPRSPGLFDEKSGVVDLQLAAIEQKGAAALLTYDRTAHNP